ncbi:MAG TPA: MFS transporter [Anaerolineales bacterium]
MNDQNSKRLFYGSCFALITTAFSFAITTGILSELGATFGLSAKQLGFINTMWFLGFPISMVLGGIFYNAIGPKRIMQIAVFAHGLGLLVTIFSGSYVGLLVGVLFIGIGNGCTEAACNPMIATAYSGRTMNMLMNRFHMWFPGGIFIASLLSFGMTGIGWGWQVQLGFIIIPMLIYAYLFWGQKFPEPTGEVASLSSNTKAMVTNPLFYFICVCMILTAISEFGPQKWTSLILSASGAEPMLILAIVTGLMAVGRYWGGDFVHKFDQPGVLLGSAIFAALGIYLLGTQTGGMAYVAAIVFAIGVCYFWPNMLGFTAEKMPKTGAIGLSIVGAFGMFSSSMWQPIIGGWIDSAREVGATAGLQGDALELAAGQATLQKMTAFPLILIVLFTILIFWMRSRKVDAAATEGVRTQAVK